MNISRAFCASYLVILNLQACGDAPEARRLGEGASASELVIDSSFFAQEYGIEPERARLVASAFQEYLRAIGGPEAYASVLEKLGAEPSPQSVHLYGSLLSLYGAVRLGKPVMDSLAAVRSRMFDLYYPSQCESLVGSQQPPAEGWRFIASMDSTLQSALFELYSTSTLAEINELGSVPRFDRPRLVDAWQTFYGELPISERERFIRFLDAPDTSVEEECWFQQHFWRLLPALPEEDARIILWQIAATPF